MGISLGGDVDQ